MEIVYSKITKQHNKTGRVWLNKGEQLNVLATHMDVLIVEQSNKNRFSIHINDVSKKQN